MRVRPVLLIPVLLAAGCQDKKPDSPAVVSDATTATAGPVGTTTGTSTASPAPPPAPLEGTVDGKPFRPQSVSLDGIVLYFRAASEMNVEASLTFSLPVSEGEKLEGREWTFNKPDDPALSLSRPGQKEPTTVLPENYTMTLRITRHTRDTVEGTIDLTVKNPVGTSLRGGFKGKFQKSPAAPLVVEDSPYVHGTIALKAAKKTEKLAAGFVGIGADGNPYSNEAGFPVDVGQGGHTTLPGNAPVQLSSLASTETAITYRHLNVPAGDYLVYVRRDTIMAAWRHVVVKPGDQQRVDLTIDPAATGEVVVTLPVGAGKEPAETSLALVPHKADLPELGLGSEQYFTVATVKMGEKTVKVQGIPAGKYRAVRGTDAAEVEVVAGKSAAVTLVPVKK